MDKPPVLEVTAGKYGELIERGPIRLSDPGKLPDGSYGYCVDLSIFGLDGMVSIKIVKDDG